MKTYSINAKQHRQILIEESGNYLIKLIGSRAHVEILGAFYLGKNQSLDLKITVIHQAKNTSADTLIKAVVEDKAVANINGKIIVSKGAQQTNSFLTENVLLIGREAKATAVPDLEIEADEVKCSHAATVGKVDEEQLFYLMSRGLSRKKGKKMITDGFLYPVYKRIINNN
jgi:Fe-S cluster assembly protein SufD